ncbi:hypothetical protein [uncultured Nostoc sp.]|uniref:hypothetical protein n=1 Tax=uncultured Nostoc sp. TaxID=340711 RepID=UPI0035CB28FD
MKLQNLLLAVTSAIASFGFSVAAKAETVEANCVIYSKVEIGKVDTVPCTKVGCHGASWALPMYKDRDRF